MQKVVPTCKAETARRQESPGFWQYQRGRWCCGLRSRGDSLDEDHGGMLPFRDGLGRASAENLWSLVSRLSMRLWRVIFHAFAAPLCRTFRVRGDRRPTDLDNNRPCSRSSPSPKSRKAAVLCRCRGATTRSISGKRKTLAFRTAANSSIS